MDWQTAPNVRKFKPKSNSSGRDGAQLNRHDGASHYGSRESYSSKGQVDSSAEVSFLPGARLRALLGSMPGSLDDLYVTKGHNKKATKDRTGWNVLVDSDDDHPQSSKHNDKDGSHAHASHHPSANPSSLPSTHHHDGEKPRQGQHLESQSLSSTSHQSTFLPFGQKKHGYNASNHEHQQSQYSPKHGFDSKQIESRPKKPQKPALSSSPYNNGRLNHEYYHAETHTLSNSHFDDYLSGVNEATNRVQGRRLAYSANHPSKKLQNTFKSPSSGKTVSDANTDVPALRLQQMQQQQHVQHKSIDHNYELLKSGDNLPQVLQQPQGSDQRQQLQRLQKQQPLPSQSQHGQKKREPRQQQQPHQNQHRQQSHQQQPLAASSTQQFKQTSSDHGDSSGVNTSEKMVGNPGTGQSSGGDKADASSGTATSRNAKNGNNSGKSIGNKSKPNAASGSIVAAAGTGKNRPPAKSEPPSGVTAPSGKNTLPVPSKSSPLAVPTKKATSSSSLSTASTPSTLQSGPAPTSTSTCASASAAGKGKDAAGKGKGAAGKGKGAAGKGKGAAGKGAVDISSHTMSSISAGDDLFDPTYLLQNCERIVESVCAAPQLALRYEEEVMHAPTWQTFCPQTSTNTHTNTSSKKSKPAYGEVLVGGKPFPGFFPNPSKALETAVEFAWMGADDVDTRAKILKQLHITAEKKETPKMCTVKSHGGCDCGMCPMPMIVCEEDDGDFVDDDFDRDYDEYLQYLSRKNGDGDVVTLGKGDSSDAMGYFLAKMWSRRVKTSGSHGGNSGGDKSNESSSDVGTDKPAFGAIKATATEKVTPALTTTTIAAKTPVRAATTSTASTTTPAYAKMSNTAPEKVTLKADANDVAKTDVAKADAEKTSVGKVDVDSKTGMVKSATSVVKENEGKAGAAGAVGKAGSGGGDAVVVDEEVDTATRGNAAAEGATGAQATNSTAAFTTTAGASADGLGTGNSGDGESRDAAAGVIVDGCELTCLSATEPVFLPEHIDMRTYPRAEDDMLFTAKSLGKGATVYLARTALSKELLQRSMSAKRQAGEKTSGSTAGSGNGADRVNNEQIVRVAANVDSMSIELVNVKENQRLSKSKEKNFMKNDSECQKTPMTSDGGGSGDHGLEKLEAQEKGMCDTKKMKTWLAGLDTLPDDDLMALHQWLGEYQKKVSSGSTTADGHLGDGVSGVNADYRDAHIEDEDENEDQNNRIDMGTVYNHLETTQKNISIQKFPNLFFPNLTVSHQRVGKSMTISKNAVFSRLTITESGIVELPKNVKDSDVVFSPFHHIHMDPYINHMWNQIGNKMAQNVEKTVFRRGLSQYGFTVLEDVIVFSFNALMNGNQYKSSISTFTSAPVLGSESVSTSVPLFREPVLFHRCNAALCSNAHLEQRNKYACSNQAQDILDGVHGAADETFTNAHDSACTPLTGDMAASIPTSGSTSTLTNAAHSRLYTHFPSCISSKTDVFGNSYLHHVLSPPSIEIIAAKIRKTRIPDIVLSSGAFIPAHVRYFDDVISQITYDAHTGLYDVKCTPWESIPVAFKIPTAHIAVDTPFTHEAKEADADRSTCSPLIVDDTPASIAVDSKRLGTVEITVHAHNSGQISRRGRGSADNHSGRVVVGDSNNDTAGEIKDHKHKPSVTATFDATITGSSSANQSTTLSFTTHTTVTSPAATSVLTSVPTYQPLLQTSLLDEVCMNTCEKAACARLITRLMHICNQRAVMGDPSGFLLSYLCVFPVIILMNLSLHSIIVKALLNGHPEVATALCVILAKYHGGLEATVVKALLTAKMVRNLHQRGDVNVAADADEAMKVSETADVDVAAGDAHTQTQTHVDTNARPSWEVWSDHECHTRTPNTAVPLLIGQKSLLDPEFIFGINNLPVPDILKRQKIPTKETFPELFVTSKYPILYFEKPFRNKQLSGIPGLFTFRILCNTIRVFPSITHTACQFSLHAGAVAAHAHALQCAYREVADTLPNKTSGTKTGAGARVGPNAHVGDGPVAITYTHPRRDNYATPTDTIVTTLAQSLLIHLATINTKTPCSISTSTSTSASRVPTRVLDAAIYALLAFGVCVDPPFIATTDRTMLATRIDALLQAKRYDVLSLVLQSHFRPRSLFSSSASALPFVSTSSAPTSLVVPWPRHKLLRLHTLAGRCTDDGVFALLLANAHSEEFLYGDTSGGTVKLMQVLTSISSLSSSSPLSGNVPTLEISASSKPNSLSKSPTNPLFLCIDGTSDSTLMRAVHAPARLPVLLFLAHTPSLGYSTATRGAVLIQAIIGGYVDHVKSILSALRANELWHVIRYKDNQGRTAIHHLCLSCLPLLDQFLPFLVKMQTPRRNETLTALQKHVHPTLTLAPGDLPVLEWRDKHGATPLHLMQMDRRMLGVYANAVRYGYHRGGSSAAVESGVGIGGNANDNTTTTTYTATTTSTSASSSTCSSTTDTLTLVFSTLTSQILALFEHYHYTLPDISSLLLSRDNMQTTLIQRLVHQAPAVLISIVMHCVALRAKETCEKQRQVKEQEKDEHAKQSAIKTKATTSSGKEDAEQEKPFSWLSSEVFLSAVTSGTSTLVSAFLQANADVNTQDTHGRSALALATALGRPHTMRVLIAAGAVASRQLEVHVRQVLAQYDTLQALRRHVFLQRVGENDLPLSPALYPVYTRRVGSAGKEKAGSSMSYQWYDDDMPVERDLTRALKNISGGTGSAAANGSDSLIGTYNAWIDKTYAHECSNENNDDINHYRFIDRELSNVVQAVINAAEKTNTDWTIGSTAAVNQGVEMAAKLRKELMNNLVEGKTNAKVRQEQIDRLDAAAEKLRTNGPSVLKNFYDTNPFAKGMINMLRPHLEGEGGKR